jgi:hypothetical protein
VRALSFIFISGGIKLGLDKFYTKNDIAEYCCNLLFSYYPEVEDKTFLEPSAGAGAFLPYLKNYIALDISPDGDNIIKQDFLTYESEEKGLIAIGNPPFGNRSAGATLFFNKAAKFCDIIAFIVPVSFQKWSVQKNLNFDFALTHFFYLPEESFIDSNGNPFKVRTVFQIWVNKNSVYYQGKKDLRLQRTPPTSHPDFNIWQYNATPQSLGVVEEDWEIATYRQGYYDYNKLFCRDDYDEIKKNMIGPPKKQYFFIQPLTDEARIIIDSMDFNNLAARNTTTPGFGKGDFVSYYEERKNSAVTKKLAI